MSARDGLERLGQRGPAGVLALDEDVRQRDARLGVHGKVLRRDLVEERDRVFGDEIDEAVGGERARELVAALVERLVEDERGRLDVGRRERRRVGGQAEEVVVPVRLGERVERVTVRHVALLEVRDDDDPVRGRELGVVGRGDRRDGRQRLLLHVRDDPVGLATAAVVRRRPVAEHLERRVAVDAVARAQVGLGRAVDLGQRDVAGLERRGRFLSASGEQMEMRGPHIAVRAPCSVHTTARRLTRHAKR